MRSFKFGSLCVFLLIFFIFSIKNMASTELPIKTHVRGKPCKNGKKMENCLPCSLQ